VNLTEANQATSQAETKAKKFEQQINAMQTKCELKQYIADEANKDLNEC
jgi:hypothetical protein